MKVRRIVSNIAVKNVADAQVFYGDILGLDIVMDQGWIRSYGANQSMNVQINVATDGGAGTELPALSIEVDDLDEALSRFKNAGINIEYGPQLEPWGVKRFYVRDPFGQLVNILAHE